MARNITPAAAEKSRKVAEMVADARLRAIGLSFYAAAMDHKLVVSRPTRSPARRSTAAVFIVSDTTLREKLSPVLRVCIEMSGKNGITYMLSSAVGIWKTVVIHDQESARARLLSMVADARAHVAAGNPIYGC